MGLRCGADTERHRDGDGNGDGDGDCGKIGVDRCVCGWEG